MRSLPCCHTGNMHHYISKALLRDNTASHQYVQHIQFGTSPSLSLSISLKNEPLTWSLPILIISKLVSQRDLERACFVWIKKCLRSARTSKQRCSCCLHPRGGSRVFVGERGGGATPLCKQLTLMAVEGWVPGAVPMFPWHGAFRPRRERAGQTEEAALGPEQNLRTPSVAFSTVEKREMGRARDRWAHPPPAGTATSICPQPRQLSFLLVITAQTAHRLYSFPLSLFHHSFVWPLHFF